MEDNNLFQLIQDRLEPEEVVDLCDIGVGELSLLLRSHILKNRARFEDFLDIYSGELL